MPAARMTYQTVFEPAPEAVTARTRATEAAGTRSARGEMLSSSGLVAVAAVVMIRESGREAQAPGTAAGGPATGIGLMSGATQVAMVAGRERGCSETHRPHCGRSGGSCWSPGREWEPGP